MNIKNPPENVLLKITSSDCTGEFTFYAKRKNYKQMKNSMSWRLVDEKGNTIGNWRDIDKWEVVDKEKVGL
jgi:hypothetical protein